MNKAVLALQTLRAAVGSEWRHRSVPSGAVQIVGLDDRNLTVRISKTLELKEDWAIPEFLREFKAALPKDQVPTWYQRLLDGKLV